MQKQTHSLFSLYLPPELMEPIRQAPIKVYEIGDDRWSFQPSNRDTYLYRTMYGRKAANGKLRVNGCAILIFTAEPKGFEILSTRLDPTIQRPRTIDVFAIFSLLRKAWYDPENSVNHHSIIEFENILLPIETQVTRLLSHRIKPGTYEGVGYKLLSYSPRKPVKVGPKPPKAVEQDPVIIAVAAVAGTDFKFFCKMAAANKVPMKLKFIPELNILRVSYRARGRTQYFKNVLQVASRGVAFETREYEVNPSRALKSIDRSPSIEDSEMPADVVRIDFYRDRLDISGHIPPVESSRRLSLSTAQS